jgi:hippurate hydrolase
VSKLAFLSTPANLQEKVLMNKTLLALSLLLGPSLVTPAIAEEALADQIAADYEYLWPLFEHFHRNPELSFLEHETAKRLAEEFEGLGFEVTTGIGETGVVAKMTNGKGPTVLVRADMDGLPVREDSGLDYSSTVTQVNRKGDEVPVMHACGHDVHITSLVGTARRLVANRDQWSGTVMLIGQPAEERIDGARAMMADGLYDRFGRPDYALAFHVDADFPAGQLVPAGGLVASSSDSIDIIVHGIGAHGASPHTGKDPILIGSQIVVALQTLVSRELSPLEPGVVTVGAFHSGFKHNIISDRAELQLTVRADSKATRDKLLLGIERIARNVGRAAGLPEDMLPEVRRVGESTTVMINDEALAKRLTAVFRDHFDKDQMGEMVRTGMGAEDFPYFTDVEPPIPGQYFIVGGTDPAALEAAQAGGPPIASHHSPFFKIVPEPSIKMGVEAMTVAIFHLLAPRGH